MLFSSKLYDSNQHAHAVKHLQNTTWPNLIVGAHSIHIPHDCEPIDFLFTHITGIVVDNSMAIVCDFGA